jgi:hypothetical protein
MVGSLIDSGANGGWAGADMRLIKSNPGERATVTGLAGRQVENLPIGTGAAYIETSTGPVIGIFHQYAFYGVGKSIHSVSQLKHFGVDIDDDNLLLGGLQRILTPDGHTIPLHIREGLAYMDIRKPTTRELQTLNHVVFTSNEYWDPRIYDNYQQQPTSTTMTTVNDLSRIPKSTNEMTTSITGVNTLPRKTRYLYVPACTDC